MKMKNLLASNSDWLKTMFEKPGMTIELAAVKANCNEKTIRRWKRKFGIRTRSMAETASLRQAYHSKISMATKNILEGELLGDGNLASNCRTDTIYAVRYQHNSSSELYLRWLAKQLSDLKCTVTGPRISTYGIGYHLRSRACSKLLPYYRRWYDETLPPRNRKIVPHNFKMTPVTALHWYMGDGTFVTDRRSLGTQSVCRLSTDGFSLKEVERLAGQLLNFRPRIYRMHKGHDGYGYRIVLNKSFLDWIGPCPIPKIYGYKWKEKRNGDFE